MAKSLSEITSKQLFSMFDIRELIFVSGDKAWKVNGTKPWYEGMLDINQLTKTFVPEEDRKFDCPVGFTYGATFTSITDRYGSFHIEIFINTKTGDIHHPFEHTDMPLDISPWPYQFRIGSKRINF